MDSEHLISLSTLSPYAYYKRALQLLEIQADHEALQALDTAIILSSSSPFYIYQKIKFLYKLGEFETCSTFILTQLDFLYKYASLYLLCRSLDYYQKINHLPLPELSNLLENKNLPFCLAEEYTHLLTTSHPNLLPSAKKAMYQDHYIQCISYCNVIAKTAHPSSEVLYMKAYSYHMLGDLYKARQGYEAYLAIAKEDASAYHALGLLLMEIGLFDQALTALQKASHLSPGNLQYLSHIGECYYATKQYALAEETFENLASCYPNDLQTYFNLSHTYKKHRKKSLYKKYTKKIKKQIKLMYNKKG